MKLNIEVSFFILVFPIKRLCTLIHNKVFARRTDSFSIDDVIDLVILLNSIFWLGFFHYLEDNPDLFLKDEITKNWALSQGLNSSEVATMVIIVLEVEGRFHILWFFAF